MEEQNKSATVEEEVKKSVALDTPKVHMWSGSAQQSIFVHIVDWEKGSFWVIKIEFS